MVVGGMVMGIEEGKLLRLGSKEYDTTGGDVSANDAYSETSGALHLTKVA